MEKRSYVPVIILAALSASSISPAVFAGAQSDRASVSQTITIRIVIPELPPLVVGTGKAALASAALEEARAVAAVTEGDREITHVLDRHGRYLTRQVSESPSGMRTLLAAP